MCTPVKFFLIGPIPLDDILSCHFGSFDQVIGQDANFSNLETNHACLDTYNDEYGLCREPCTYCSVKYSKHKNAITWAFGCDNEHQKEFEFELMNARGGHICTIANSLSVECRCGNDYCNNEMFVTQKLLPVQTGENTHYNKTFNKLPKVSILDYEKHSPPSRSCFQYNSNSTGVCDYDRCSYIHHEEMSMANSRDVRLVIYW